VAGRSCLAGPGAPRTVERTKSASGCRRAVTDTPPGRGLSKAGKCPLLGAEIPPGAITAFIASRSRREADLGGRGGNFPQPQSRPLMAFADGEVGWSGLTLAHLPEGHQGRAQIARGHRRLTRAGAGGRIVWFRMSASVSCLERGIFLALPVFGRPAEGVRHPKSGHQPAAETDQNPACYPIAAGLRCRA
jgi:hypothetical protein